MIFFKTHINATLADDKLRFLKLDAMGARFMLMCYIAKSPIMNFLYRTPSSPYPDSEIAVLLHVGLQEWLQIKEQLLKYGGFAIDLNKAVGIPKFSEHQSDYYRQKIYRKVTDGVTPDSIQQLQTEVRSKKLEDREKTKILSPIQQVIEYYKSLKGIDPTDKSWDRIHYKTCVRFAQNTLEAVGGDISKAKEGVKAIGDWLTGIDLAWSMAAVARHIHEWKGGRLNGGSNGFGTRKRGSGLPGSDEEARGYDGKP